jgi:hypothetical protein
MGEASVSNNIGEEEIHRCRETPRSELEPEVIN